MTKEERMLGWNNLVMNTNPAAFEVGDKRRAAAIASMYIGCANNGGLNSFLTSSYDLDSREVLESLEALGASVAAAQLRQVLEKIGDPLPVSTQDERWKRLDDHWTDELDELDVLSEEADLDLTVALEKHVQEFSDFYLRMTDEDATK
jgi:hypothetical protein